MANHIQGQCGHKLDEVVSADRLQAMMNALSSGAEIDVALRAEIVDALKGQELSRLDNRSRSTRDVGTDNSILLGVALTKALLDFRGLR